MKSTDEREAFKFDGYSIYYQHTSDQNFRNEPSSNLLIIQTAQQIRRFCDVFIFVDWPPMFLRNLEYERDSMYLSNVRKGCRSRSQPCKLGRATCLGLRQSGHRRWFKLVS